MLDTKTLKPGDTVAMTFGGYDPTYYPIKVVKVSPKGFVTTDDGRRWMPNGNPIGKGETRRRIVAWDEHTIDKARRYELINQPWKPLSRLEELPTATLERLAKALEIEEGEAQ